MGDALSMQRWPDMQKVAHLGSLGYTVVRSEATQLTMTAAKLCQAPTRQAAPQPRQTMDEGPAGKPAAARRQLWVDSAR